MKALGKQAHVMVGTCYWKCSVDGAHTDWGVSRRHASVNRWNGSWKAQTICSGCRLGSCVVGKPRLYVVTADLAVALQSSQLQSWQLQFRTSLRLNDRLKRGHPLVTWVLPRVGRWKPLRNIVMLRIRGSATLQYAMTLVSRYASHPCYPLHNVVQETTL